MSDEDEAKRLAEEASRQQREADLVQYRIRELHLNPIQGDFDAEHLKAVHAHIFQDFPEHKPGVVREGTGEGWIKERILEGTSDNYVVHYADRGIESKIATTLDQFGGAEALKGLTPDAAAGRIAELYGDLDHAHGFSEGNSRTLREFTRELAKEAGFTLDWTGTSVSEAQRNELYMARDLAVMERAFPDLTPAKAMQTNDRLEFEASFAIEALRNDVGDRSIEAIIRDGLTPGLQLEQGQVIKGQEHQAQEAAPLEHAAEVTEHVGVEQVAEAVENVAASVFDAVADIAGKATEAISSAFESLLGGESSRPAPKQQQIAETPARKPQTMEEFRAMEQQQRQADKQELAKSLGASEALTEEELRREQMEQQKNSRDRGGGISR